MTPALKLVSLVSLAATIVPSLLFLTGGIDSHDLIKWIALVGTIAWFVATPMWMGAELDPASDQVEI